MTAIKRTKVDTSDEIIDEDLEFTIKDGDEERLVDLDFTKRQHEGHIYESIEQEIGDLEGILRELPEFEYNLEE